MEEHMTPEPKETLTDEPQVKIEETNEPTDELPAAEEVDTARSDDVEQPTEPAEDDAKVAEADPADQEVTEVVDPQQDAGQEQPDEPLDEADTTDELEQSPEVTPEEYEGEPEQSGDDDREVETAMGEEQAPTIESVIEAVLFASDEPLTDSRIANIVETTGKQVRQSIEELNQHYESNNHAFRIEQIAGGYQMLTLSSYNGWLKKMLRARGDTKLSPAAMETLAIIAYKQPIIRADIEAIRGVAVGEVIRSLMYKGLVKIVGRAEVLGRPMLYGTTKKFLEIFGLNSLKDLPKVEELKNPDR
jgi:segregation and condensation protein B